VSDASLRLTEAYVRASQQFDYFVTGGSGAALAYGVQSFDRRIPLRWDFLAPIAWALLFLAVLAGIWHLSTVVAYLRMVPLEYSFSESAEALREAESKGVGAYLSGADLPIPPNAVGYAREKLEIERGKMTTDFVSKSRQLVLLARARNAFLLAGLLTLGVWKASSLWQ
jgi:hypothetical protein